MEKVNTFVILNEDGIFTEVDADNKSEAAYKYLLHKGFEVFIKDGKRDNEL